MKRLKRQAMLLVVVDFVIHIFLGRNQFYADLLFYASCLSLSGEIKSKKIKNKKYSVALTEGKRGKNRSRAYGFGCGAMLFFPALFSTLLLLPAKVSSVCESSVWLFV